MSEASKQKATVDAIKGMATNDFKYHTMTA